jgi:hypothetical protein
MVDEVQHLLVRPVKILDHEDQRSLLGKRLEEPAPRGERVSLRIAPELGFRGPDPHQRPQVPCDPLCLAVVGKRIGDRLPQLLLRPLRTVPLEDRRMRFHDLADRPKRDAVTVGKATSLPPEHRAVRGERAEELEGEPALADPRNPHQRHELRLAIVARALRGVEQEGELLLAADQLRASGLHDVDAELRSGRDRLPGPNWIGLPFRLDRFRLAVIDEVAGGAIRRFADEDAVHRRGGLEARRRVDDVAGRHPLPSQGTGAERDQRLAGVDRDPQLQLFVLQDPVANRKRGVQCTLRIVLMRDRRAEQRHHCVADELLDGAAEALELRTQPLVVRSEQRPYVLGIHLLCTRGEAHQVGEQHGDDLAFLTRRLRGQRRAACVAEARLGAVLVTTGRADAHTEKKRTAPSVVVLAAAVNACREDAARQEPAGPLPSYFLL